MPTYGGSADLTEDHWERVTPQEDIFNGLSGAIRELSLNASGYYIGATTNIALGRLLGSALQGIPRSAAPQAHALGLPMNTGPRSPPVENNLKLPGLGLFSRDEAPILFQAYLKFISTEYPILHTKRLHDIHARRGRLKDAWEVAVLHHIYGIGGKCLELVSRYLLC